jgi:branched-chain amino acid transport system ATP-binding protein
MSPISCSVHRYRLDQPAKEKRVLLEVDGINTFRGPAHILRGVSLNIGDHEVVSLVGRNGAGRTTIIESITGLLPVRSGRIRFRGAEITGLPPHRRARCGIGLAPENSGIFSELTVAENLMISRWLSNRTTPGAPQSVDAEAQALTVFPEVRKLMTRRGLNLSGGQKKMVSIARAMALAPSLMILDEAFEGLAPAVVKRFREAVLMIKSMGISLLIAESNLVSASAIADRLYVIDRGEIIFHGTPQEALADEAVMRALRG